MSSNLLEIYKDIPSLESIIKEACKLRPDLCVTEALEYYQECNFPSNGLQQFLRVKMARELQDIIQKQHDDFIENLIHNN